MGNITRPVIREIIDDFAREIAQKKTATATPKKTVINFRTDKQDSVEREIYQVPIDILRFRKDNGRIASDVMDYEKNYATLDEKNENDQDIIRKFLREKDPEPTKDLVKSIEHSGQSEPAIITCDGFLVNGNRRKMAMEILREEHPGNNHYNYMKVVILPGPSDPGGAPDILEIERIENRYQLQRDGKSEYYKFDRALSIKRKIDHGFTLRDQLSDDPKYAGASEQKIQKAIDEFMRDYLDPLACVDRYLKQFGRPGLYRTISMGMSDPEGRWQAFTDYSKVYSGYFRNPKRMLEIGIEENEIGEIETAAFNIIRLRHIPDLPKVHSIMRDLPKYCRTPEGKKSIKKIAEKVQPRLPDEESKDEKENPLTLSEMDHRWAAKNKQDIIYHLKRAVGFHESQKEKDTPIELLEAAYKKLMHINMEVTSIALSDLKAARELAVSVKERALDIEKEIYHWQKESKNLGKSKA